jgi:hypothetical protein
VQFLKPILRAAFGPLFLVLRTLQMLSVHAQNLASSLCMSCHSVITDQRSLAVAGPNK